MPASGQAVAGFLFSDDKRKPIPGWVIEEFLMLLRKAQATTKGEIR
jgi:hypothetical protein